MFRTELAVLTGFLTTAAAQAPVADFRFLATPPLGLPAMPVPAGQPPTEAMFALGAKLFRDPLLSSDRSVSCQNCHRPDHAYSSPEPLPAGVHGRRALRHAPALVNRAYGQSMRWDGRTRTIEEFVLQPISDPNEMDLPLAQALARLRADPDYPQRFAAAFADGLTAANLATSLATFVRGIAAGDAPVDRFHQGAPDALTPAQRSGLWVFESKGGCWRCHTMPLFTDEGFHDTGIGVVEGKPEPGRAAHTGDVADTGRFKTPTLRGVRLSAPYMHDGSLKTLTDVIEFYDRGGNANAHLDPNLKPLQLTADDKRHLLAFLESL